MNSEPKTPRSTSENAKLAAKQKPSEASRNAKVPPEAENFEHTIRRMIHERDELRRKNEGMYR